MHTPIMYYNNYNLPSIFFNQTPLFPFLAAGKGMLPIKINWSFGGFDWNGDDRLKIHFFELETNLFPEFNILPGQFLSNTAQAMLPIHHLLNNQYLLHFVTYSKAYSQSYVRFIIIYI